MCAGKMYLTWANSALLHMHFDICWSFSLICIVHFIIDLIFQMNSIISINLMIKSPLQYMKVQCKTRIVGVNFYFACGILYRYNCKMVLRGQSNQTYSSGFKSRFLGFIMERPHIFHDNSPNLFGIVCNWNLVLILGSKTFIIYHSVSFLVPIFFAKTKTVYWYSFLHLWICTL